MKHEAVKVIISSCNENKCVIWKNDIGTEEYYFFNSMPDLRVYYCNTTDNKVRII